MDDFDLLQDYASQRKEDAFNKLTGRYIDLVYSAAARQTGNSQAAEDVTQAVFLTLARKAGAISRGTVLAGWLLRTTRFAAANARRLEQRRQHYEQQAMQSYLCPGESEAAWQRISPLLDEALDRLGEKDRDAIALRFLEHKSLRQVAEKLGVSEDGAQKRVTRAIEELRAFFGRHGKGVSTVALTGALASNSVEAAPAALAASISAMVTAQGAVAGSAVAVLAKATAGALTRAKLQVFAVRAASVAVFLSLAIVTFVRTNPPAADSNMIWTTRAGTVFGLRYFWRTNHPGLINVVIRTLPSELIRRTLKTCVAKLLNNQCGFQIDDRTFFFLTASRLLLVLSPTGCAGFHDV